MKDKGIIDKVVEETRRKIRKQKAEHQDVVDHFGDPFPDHLEGFIKRAAFVEDHLHGKYSVESVEKAYDGLRELAEQEIELDNMLFLLGRLRKQPTH